MASGFEKLAEIRPGLPEASVRHPTGDEFLSPEDLVTVVGRMASTRRKAVTSEMEELIREKQWQAIVDLFMPVEEKQPELAETEMDLEVREKLAFALGQLARFDEAIAELTVCVGRAPDRFLSHNSLAYTAYSSLFAAKNREILLSGKARTDRIALAHRHFEIAQQLRPDSVTNLYRRGMLYRKIEGKTHLALPLFVRAVAGWTSLTEAERERRHQERKNYVKALYQQAGSLSETGKHTAALDVLKRCLSEDEQSNHLSLLHKYFALGKVEYHLGHFKEARDALLFAEKCVHGQPADFVYELQARVYLALKSPRRAASVLEKVPAQRRRPYFRWTEADVLCALERYEDAKEVLVACCARDNRSRHKGLIRVSKIEYLFGNHPEGARAALEADRFFREKWGNPYGEGMFWRALNLFRSGDCGKARAIAEELGELFPNFPKLDRLRSMLKGRGDAEQT